MLSNDIINAVKNAYANGTGTFAEVCEAAGLDYYKAGTNPAKKRGTPTTTINGKVYDFHGLLKLAGVEIVKHERLTAGGERIPAQRSRVEKVKAAQVMFVTRLMDITGIKPATTDEIDLNSICDKAMDAAAELDKRDAEKREAAAAAAKVERKRKAAAAKVEKSSEEDKLYLAAAALGISVEELKALKKNIKPAKVTK